MYEANLNPTEFLFLIYVNIEKKIEKILELKNSKNSTYKDIIFIYETKRKLVEIFDILTASTKNEKLALAYNFISEKIFSEKDDDLKFVLNFCKKARST